MADPLPEHIRVALLDPAVGYHLDEGLLPYCDGEVAIVVAFMPREQLPAGPTWDYAALPDGARAWILVGRPADEDLAWLREFTVDGRTPEHAAALGWTHAGVRYGADTYVRSKTTGPLRVWFVVFVALP